ncbi:MAG: pentapeptide repeat-containing protein [Terracidiphilus sp.]|jgi:hypothetical protein
MAEEQENASDVSASAEPEIAPDEIVGTEPEIERVERSEEEPEKEPEESAAAKVDSGEAGCPIRMGEGKVLRCGREFHVAHTGVDEQPVCLMHSKDPNKQSGPLFDAFWLEFERTLEEAGGNEAIFEGFVFPQVDLTAREFKAVCRFGFAIFTQDVRFNFSIFRGDASFNKSTFAQDAHFWDVTFTRDALFNFATFRQKAFFRRATFAGDASLEVATFMQDAHFGCATFKQDADFDRAIFTQNADFQGASFARNATFGNSSFMKEADFSNATFMQNADFRIASFAQGAVFRSAVFMQKADFRRTTFARSAFFNDAIFTLAARFLETRFQGTASWRGSRFLDRAEFRRTVFDPQIAGHESALFALAAFNKPAEIVFDDVDLSRAFFHNCDVSQLWFTSSVRWANREGNRGLAVYEETIPLKEYRALELKRDGQRDYHAVAQIYQQLKKNYDSRLDYWTANEFHFGEMEMKRLAGPTGGPFLRLRRWLHPRLSLVALYRCASDYGNGYGKPVLWLLGILALSAALLPLPGVGLKQQGASRTETYTSTWNLQKNYGENLRAEARLTGRSAITAVDTATFQKSAEYAPAYPWGRVLAIFETLLTSTLFGLFLLAIRRQFRR